MQNKYRKLYKKLLEHLPRKEFAIITGARQTGKTTLIEQLKEEFDKRKLESYLLSVEDPVLLKALNSHPENIFQFIPQPENKHIILFIDEIQYLKDPSNFLKLLFDKYHGKLKIYATGSSAFYIDKKFKDSLAGRKRIFRLNTLNFEEFLDFKTGNDKILDELKMIRTNKNYISIERKRIESYLNDFLTYGGYPAVVLSDSIDEKKILLKEIWQSYLKRDMTDSLIKNEDKFYNLLKILAHQSGNLLNMHELANTLQISAPSVERYIYILRKSFHISLVRPFYNNIRKELTKMPKFYFNDLGLRNIITNSFNPVFDKVDKGAVVENYVFLRLAETYDLDEIKYWRTTSGNEVDFVVSTSYNEGFAIEVKYNSILFNPKKYNKFIETYPNYPLSVRAYESTSNEDSILGL
jgi:predicted AAA+ superfamily ATPase